MVFAFAGDSTMTSFMDCPDAENTADSMEFVICQSRGLKFSLKCQHPRCGKYGCHDGG
ncbi:MAG: Uncharacterised protein [SAR116 cluster bacterium]|nr:MAG: Uncharacterised protein [SAR116 cluster bacterium]